MASLPQPKEAREKLGTPLWFDEEDEKWLVGTNVEMGVKERRKSWQEEWRKGRDILEEAGGDVDGYDWETILWAASIFSSRSFVSSLLSQALPDVNTQTSVRGLRKDDGFPVLFPLVDILNHNPGAQIHWIGGKESMDLVLEDGVQPGEEVFNNYGPKSNEELLLGYGFCLPDNPYDQLAIKFNPPFTMLQRDIRRRQSSYEPISSEATKTSTNMHYIRSPTSHYTSGYSSPTLSLRPFPPALLDTLAILLANAREQRLLYDCPDCEWAAGGPLGSPGWRLKVKIMSQLRSELGAKREKMRMADEGLSKKGTISMRQRNAKIYRDGQRAILDEVLGLLDHQLVSATSDSTSSSSSLPPGHFKTLSQAIKALKTLPLPPIDTTNRQTPYPTPQALHKHFKTLLRSTFGSSDLDDLREAGWQRTIWALWLNAVRIWFEMVGGERRIEGLENGDRERPKDQDDDIQTNVIQADVMTNSISLRLRKWMEFLLHPSTYGPQPSSSLRTSPSPEHAPSQEITQEATSLHSMLSPFLTSRDASPWFTTNASWSIDRLAWGLWVVEDEVVELGSSSASKKGEDVEREEVVFLEDLGSWDSIRGGRNESSSPMR
ncbi:MAG: hypothetical protein M1817_003056 [Caeruleum heppii]|nr:MAG: hypothetical protein M1817_003056 [Caeruleum heppii]